MAENLDVVIVDDDPAVCSVVSEIMRTFYTWGDVRTFINADKAIAFCRTMDTGVAIFVLDVYIGKDDCFGFLDAIADKFPMAFYDTIVITGNASDDIVDMCVASDITHLIEKPIKPYALQLAVRSIVARYLRFAKKLLADPEFAQNVAGF
jgi:DNA-binding NtrC family response regulator